MAEGPSPDARPPGIRDAAFQAYRNGVLILDRDLRIVARSRALTEMFPDTAPALEAHDLQGYDETVARLLLVPAPPLSAVLASLDPEHAAVHRLRTLTGKVYERQVTAVRVEGEVGGVLITFTDITRIVLAEEALVHERAFLEKAQEVAHIGSWAVDLDDRGRLEWSPEMYKILGVARDTVTSRTRAMAELVHPDDRDRVRSAREAALAAGQPYEFEHRIIRPDGAVRWAHTRADILCDADGRPVRVVGTLQDVTARRELEEQLRQSQKLDAVGRLAGGVAHDLNNALTAIIGYSELVIDAMPETLPHRRDVLEIRRAAERAETVVRQLLAFSRRQQAEPRVFPLDAAVADVSRMLQRLFTPHITVTAHIAADLPPIHSDPGQIEQAIMNLALNARDAMPQGGTFALTLSLTELDHEFVRSRPPLTAGPYLELSATDTGEGMTPQTLAHIFEPFFTTKEVGKGTGLGLSMVYGTVEQAGGCIVVESEVGKGSTFRLYFPPARPAPATVAPPTAPTGPHAATILVVDDQPQVRDIAAAALRRAGYRVMTAGSGPEAIALAGSKHAGLDLLLTDVNMPEMSGRELAARLLDTHPDLRIIVMSGLPSDALGLPTTGRTVSVLTKPFTQAMLRQRVREVLAASIEEGV